MAVYGNTNYLLNESDFVAECDKIVTSIENFSLTEGSDLPNMIYATVGNMARDLKAFIKKLIAKITQVCTQMRNKKLVAFWKNNEFEANKVRLEKIINTQLYTKIFTQKDGGYFISLGDPVSNDSIVEKITMLSNGTYFKNDSEIDIIDFMENGFDEDKDEIAFVSDSYLLWKELISRKHLVINILEGKNIYNFKKQLALVERELDGIKMWNKFDTEDNKEYFTKVLNATAKVLNVWTQFYIKQLASVVQLTMHLSKDDVK